MHLYKPDPKAAVILRVEAIDLSPKWRDNRLASNSWDVTEGAIRTLAKQLGARVGRLCFWKYKVLDPRLPAAIAELRNLTDRLLFRLECAWVEGPAPTDKKAGHQVWYELREGPTTYSKLAEIHVETHFGRCGDVLVASDQMIATIWSARLAGLEILPLVDSRDGDERTWSEVFASLPMGRGLDHPTIDPEKLERDRAKSQGWDFARRRGEPTGWQEMFWDDLQIDHPVLSEFARVRMKYFSFRGPVRYCLERLPPSDFAYRDWTWRADVEPGAKSRTCRSICCNARARKVLIDAGLMKPSRFEPIQIVPAADAQAAILDDVIPYPLPLPVYTPEEAEVERARREKLRAAAPRPESGLTFDSVPAAIQFLENRAASPKRAWTPAHEHPDFAKIVKSRLFKKTPVAWQLLAPWLPFEAVLEEGEKQFWFTLCAPEWNTWLIADEGDPDDIPSKHDLVIGQTPFGDWFSFRKGDPLLPGDARIREWDHETSTPRDDWASVLGFAAHLVEVADRAAKIGYKPSI